MINVVIALECFGICLTAIALFLLLNGDGAREQKLLIMILCGSLVQNVGYLLELIAPTMEAAMTAVTMEKVGSAFTPLCYCWFISRGSVGGQRGRILPCQSQLWSPVCVFHHCTHYHSLFSLHIHPYEGYP